MPGHSSTDANVSQAVPLPPNRVFVSKGYGRGAAVIELTPTGDGSLPARTVWRKAKVLRTKSTNVTVLDR